MPTETIKTPFGEYAITAKGDKAWLHTAYNSVGEANLCLTINGISFIGSIYLKYEMHWDAEKMIKGWHRDNTQGGMYLKRVDNTWAGITSNMMDKVYNELIPWASNWLSNNPNFVHEGWKEIYRDSVINAKSLVAKAHKDYEAAKIEELEAADVFADFLSGLLTPPEPDDMCKCGHIRQSHSSSCQEYPTGSYRRCDCMEFTNAAN